MAVVMVMRWEGVTPEQYDSARELIDWEQQTATGGDVHVAWFDQGALRVVDVWDEAEDFDRFVNDRLMPVVKGQLGIEGEPEVSIYPLHRRFINPGRSGGAS